MLAAIAVKLRLSSVRRLLFDTMPLAYHDDLGLAQLSDISLRES
jgi:hypothetical protein